MRKIDTVEEAKALLAEAKDWGTWRWLTEKKRVRAAADAAWAGLEEIERDIKGAWGDDLRKAYRELQASSKKRTADADGVDPQVKAFAARLKQEDDDAFQARMNAEETFDEAERRLSVSLARHGCEQAIEAYQLRERFIRKAEAARTKWTD
jgi:hypothetical protein